MYSISGYCGGQPHHGQHRGDSRGCRKTTSTRFQRPDADYLGVDPRRDDAAAATPVRCRSARSPARARASAAIVGYKTPGFDTNDLGFMRRADEKNQSNWFQWRNFKPGKYVRTRNFNINQYAGWNFGGDRTVFGRQHQLALDVHELLQHRRRLQPRRGAVPRSRDARRPRRARQSRASNVWYYANTDNRKALSFYYNGGHWADTKNSVAARHQSRRELARDLVDVAERRPPLRHQPRRFAVGRRTKTSPTARRATCSGASIRRRCRSPRASTTR